MPTPDLTTLSSAKLEELSSTELEELLAEPVATIGWFDLLGMGRKGTTISIAVVTKRYTLKGIDDQNFALSGIDDQNFILKGSDDRSFISVGH